MLLFLSEPPKWLNTKPSWFSLSHWEYPVSLFLNVVIIGYWPRLYWSSAALPTSRLRFLDSRWNGTP